MSGNQCKRPSKLPVPIEGLESDRTQQPTKFAFALPPSSSHRNTSSQATRVPILTELSQTGRPPPIPDTQEAFGARSTVSDVNRFTTMTCDPGEEQGTEGSAAQTQVNDPPIIINNIRSWWRDYHTHTRFSNQLIQDGKRRFITFKRAQLVKHVGFWKNTVKIWSILIFCLMWSFWTVLTTTTSTIGARNTWKVEPLKHDPKKRLQMLSSCEQIQGPCRGDVVTAEKLTFI